MADKKTSAPQLLAAHRFVLLSYFFCDGGTADNLSDKGVPNYSAMA